MAGGEREARLAFIRVVVYRLYFIFRTKRTASWSKKANGANQSV